MLNRRITEFAAAALDPGEALMTAMVGFRPISRSFVFFAVFPAVLGGFALSSAAGWQARLDHDGRGLSIGLAVTDRRLLVIEMRTGLIMAGPVAIERSIGRDEIVGIETATMQGSGLKRPGAAIRLVGGEEVRVLPARIGPFLEALEAS
jgi:hypothetical protein